MNNQHNNNDRVTMSLIGPGILLNKLCTVTKTDTAEMTVNNLYGCKRCVRYFTVLALAEQGH